MAARSPSINAKKIQDLMEAKRQKRLQMQRSRSNRAQESERRQMEHNTLLDQAKAADIPFAVLSNQALQNSSKQSDGQVASNDAEDYAPASSEPIVEKEQLLPPAPATATPIHAEPGPEEQPNETCLEEVGVGVEVGLEEEQVVVGAGGEEEVVVVGAGGEEEVGAEALPRIASRQVSAVGTQVSRAVLPDVEGTSFVEIVSPHPVPLAEDVPYMSHELGEVVHTGLYSHTVATKVEGIACVVKAPPGFETPPSSLWASDMGEISLSERRDLRLRREADALQRLTHPNIPYVVETITNHDSQATHLVLERIYGSPLMRDQQFSEPFPENIAHKHFIQLIDLIAYCHGVGVSHGNIKPSNLLLAEQSLSLVDFSCSRVFEPLRRPEGSYSDLRRPEPDIVPSAPISSPQLAAGVVYRLQANDIWMCGITLYMMMYGRCPILCDTKAQTLSRLKNFKRPRFPKSPKTSNDVRELLKSILNPREDKRATLHDIKNHSWVRSGPPPPCENPETDSPFSSKPSLSRRIHTLFHREPLK